MKKCLLLVIFLGVIVQVPTWAQSKLTKAFARSMPSENAVQVKWIVWMPDEVQYHVLRRAVGEKAFTRLTKTPIQPVALPLSDNGTGPVADARRTYAQFRKSVPETKNEGQFFFQLYGMNAYTNNDFARVAGMYFKDNTVVPGQTYQYVVSVVYKGKEYNWGQTGPVRAGDYKPLDAPVGLKAVQQGTNRIALSWAIRPDVMAYDVYRRRGNGTETKLNKKPVVVIDAVNGKRPSTQFTDTDSTLQAGETYYYRIAALDPFVNAGQPSQAVWVLVKDMTPPAGATSLQARIEKKNVRLRWLPSISRDCIGYRLFRGTAMDKPFRPVLPTLIPAADTAFTDLAPEGAMYYYYLRAEDQAGNGVNSAPVQVSHPDLTPPRSPAGLTVQTDTMGHVTLTWRAGQEADLRGYFVYRALQNQNDNYAQLQLKPLSATTFRDTLPRTNQNAFYYRVTAIDKKENESVPALLTVRLPDRQAPQAPRLTSLAAAADSVLVAWQASTSADVRSYQILRRSEGDRSGTFQVVGNATGSRFADQRLAGGTYAYALVAVDSAGNRSMQSIPQLVEISGKYALTAPQEVMARLSERDKKLTVNWKITPQPADFVGYRVLARTTGETFQAVTPLLVGAQAVLPDWEAGTDYEIAVVAISQTGQRQRSAIVKAVSNN